MISAVIEIQIDNVNELAHLQQETIERDIKSEYLFRRCSFATNLVTSFQLHFTLLWYYAVPFLTNYGSVFIHSLIP